MPKATHLECSLCGAKHDALAVANLCACGGPLLVRYDLAVIRHRWLRPNRAW
jgi:threonine synthase